jgi:hypothetical protein
VSTRWLRRGLPRPDWVYVSEVGTAFDESNVRKASHAILDKARLHRRVAHQMRHTFASLFLQAGEPITYVSRQLGHKDSAITLRVQAHWLPDSSTRKDVDRLDPPKLRVASSLQARRMPILRRRRKQSFPLEKSGEPDFRELEPHNGLAASCPLPEVGRRFHLSRCCAPSCCPRSRNVS